VNNEQYIPLPFNSITTLSLIVVLLPLLSFIIISFLKGKRSTFSHVISISAIAFSTCVSAFVFLQTWNVSSSVTRIHWIEIGDLQINIGIVVDNISALMLLLVAFISTLVQLFSVSYMKGDKDYSRYFAHLSLFCFSMLGLVLTDNLLILYIFWELVGFSSYLLIGFWREKQSAIIANKKAFIMNRIGDMGFLLGIFILFSQFNTLDLSELKNQVALKGNATLTSAGICIFLGAVAKSAQFPLHTWLPDAMEGPTPVSSLIHAATMVAAGVYLLVRTFAFFTPDVLLLIASIGSFTAFMAATIALVQNDIKKVLAYSTISQLGYMIMAIGVGSASSAFTHLFAHAFFKCCLFLCAGVIIHELKHLKEKDQIHFDEQDMRNMGGLRKKLPFTFIAYTLSAAALIGLPFFTGFLSKDAILIQSFEWTSTQSEWTLLIPLLAFASVLLTAVYVARQYFLVFFGEFKFSNEVRFKETNAVKVPLVILCLCSLFFILSPNPFSISDSWLMRSFNETLSHNNYIPVLSIILSIVGILAAYFIYLKKKIKPLNEKIFIYQFLFNGWYIDKTYDVLIVKPVVLFAEYVRRFDVKVIDGWVNAVPRITIIIADVVDWIDRNIIDGMVNLIARIARASGNFIRVFQTGRVQTYFGLAIFGLLLIYILKLFL
jgi:NADH-quinone oxidoreductase subunit L